MIAIIDYGSGNLRSVQKAFEKCGVSVRVTNDKQVIRDAAGIVLPGVGSFDHAVGQLRKKRLDIEIINAINKGKPYLGFCLGLQLLFDNSDEGHTNGLGLIPGKVLKFPKWLKAPHMGWNRVQFNEMINPDKKSRRFIDGYYYFVHSYFVAPKDPTCVLGWTDYHQSFVSAIAKDNIIATQFHPEKSQAFGLSFIKIALSRLGLS